jgi:hypothetical protein
MQALPHRAAHDCLNQLVVTSEAGETELLKKSIPRFRFFS